MGVLHRLLHRRNRCVATVASAQRAAVVDRFNPGAPDRLPRHPFRETCSSMREHGFHMVARCVGGALRAWHPREMPQSSLQPTLHTVAVASNHPRGLDSPVGDSLTSSPFLTIATVAGHTLVAWATVSNPTRWVTSQGLPSEIVMDFDVEAVVAGTVDGATSLALEAQGIRIITGAPGCVREAIDRAVQSAESTAEKQRPRGNRRSRPRGVRAAGQSRLRPCLAV